jgi:Fibronectin type III domain
LLSVVSLSALLALTPAAARAQSCMTLQYSFQPDCYRPDESSACVQSVSQMELGPQIAVWLQDATGAYVDTLMVTNATARRGIGNRPGRWDFLSGPLFPYGKRLMSLPIWAHARGKIYNTVIMQEAVCSVGGPGESCLGWHESYSSPELYFCRPLMQTEAQGALGNEVDAITCPTTFHSEKGKFDPTTPNYYPPRSDLTSFTSLDGPDPPTFAAINDLDAVAAATPAYGSVYSGTWSVPSTLSPGDYTVMVEVNKEYDSNASNTHPDFTDPNLSTYGTSGNFGQPSVVYEIPLHIDLTMATKDAGSVSEITGYGDWTGATGVVNPRDATISTTNPGSGEARLLSISNSAGQTGRVLASVAPCFATVCDPTTNMCSMCDPTMQACTPLQCVPPPAPPSAVTNLSVQDDGLTATTATLQFVNAQSSAAGVLKYDIRYQTGATITDDQFGSAASAPPVMPGTPGTLASVSISNLKPGTQYAVAVRAIDPCGQASPTATLTFTTPSMKFTQLTGCFVATAAWGSALAPDVAAMRKVRDRLRPQSTMFAVATDLYYRSGPAAAEVLRRSDTARALVRRLLAPIGAASKAAVALASAGSAR